MMLLWRRRTDPGTRKDLKERDKEDKRNKGQTDGKWCVDMATMKSDEVAMGF